DVSGTKNIKIRSTVASADAGFHLGTNGDVSLYSGSLSTGFSDAIGGVKVWGNTVEIKGSLNLDTSSTNDPALIIPAGDLLTTPTSGSIENDGDHLYYTDSSGTRYQIDQQGGGGGSGTVTSVGLSVPTGLTVSGSPITTSGTLAISLDTGYVIPLSASTTNWNTFYVTPSNRITAGTGIDWSSNTLNVTLDGLSTTNLSEGSNLYYTDARVGAY